LSVDVRARPEVSQDLTELGSNALRLEAIKFMVELREKPYLGQPLANLPETGDLSDCRKIYFDEARHRVIYRLLPDQKGPTSIDVIAVGPREAAAVYTEAVRRLGRHE